jgi:superfamily II DNA or RNA helicase
MTNTITIISNATVAKAIEPTREQKAEISKLLSYTVAGFENMSGGKSGWDGKSSFFSARKCTFPAGFSRTVVAHFKRKGVKVTWVKKPLPPILGEMNPIVDDFGYTDIYDYQPETIERLLKYGQMVAKVATGGGKSRIARIGYKTIARKTLFITTRGTLMYQMKRDFEEALNEKTGVIGDGEWQPVEGFNVGMVQTIAKRLLKKNVDDEIDRAITLEDEADQKKRTEFVKKLTNKKVEGTKRIQFLDAFNKKLKLEKKTNDQLLKDIIEKVNKHNAQRLKMIDFLATIEFVIFEEAHEAGGDEYYRVGMALKNAHYRLSLTGTAFQREAQEDNFRLMAVSGLVGIEISEKLLIDRGILATPVFTYLPVADVKGLFRSSPYVKGYKLGIVENEGRTQKIIDTTTYLSEYGLTAIVLVNRKAHGESIKRKLITAGLKVNFIYGDKSQEERQNALNKLGKGVIDVLIGTSILDVGVDVPSVGSIILAGGGKSEIANRQRVGRGLRRKKIGPNYCFVFDFMDSQNSHIKTHYLQRRRIIEETPGFRENIIEKLNLEDYGFKKVK